MTFRPRNAYYLRISTNIVLPLFLYLDEQHVDWMSDVVLQHVLANLRPLIIPKLQAEKDVHFGLGAVPVNKRGTVEVHRGETYQFAYFFRKTEPHTVLFRSRCFVAASPRQEVVSKPGPLPDRNHPKRSRMRVSTKQSKRKRAQSQGKDKSSDPDEDEWFAEESEEYSDDPILMAPHPARKQRRVTGRQEDDEHDMVNERQNITGSLPLKMNGGSTETPGTIVSKDRDAVTRDMNEQLSETIDVELVVEEEEEKPKPFLKLQYQSFPITGHCLCVVVEPWPPLHTTIKLSPDFAIPIQRRELESSRAFSEPVAGQRAQTPLFLPEYDGATSEAHFARERTLPHVPLFDAVARIEDIDHSDDGLMNFSQTLIAGGHMHTIEADDDDMDGAILFGDADEVRELF